MNENGLPVGAWHYTDTHGLLGMIQNNTVWAGATDFMNDEQELLHGLSLLKRRWVDNPQRPEGHRRIVREALQGFEDSNEQQYIVSASEESDSLTLWRNYGHESIGYAVCFDRSVSLVPLTVPRYAECDRFPYAGDDYLDPYIEEVEFDGQTQHFLSEDPDQTLSRHNREWTSVIYEPEEQEQIVDQVAQEILEVKAKYVESALNFYAWGKDMQWKDQLALLKDPGFMDEREIRRHYSWVLPSWRFVRYRATRFGVTPYVEVTTRSPGAEEVDFFGSPDDFETQPRHLPILGVRIGPTRYAEQAKQALTRLLQEHGYGNVSVWNSAVPYR